MTEYLLLFYFKNSQNIASIGVEVEVVAKVEVKVVAVKDITTTIIIITSIGVPVTTVNEKEKKEKRGKRKEKKDKRVCSLNCSLISIVYDLTKKLFRENLEKLTPKIVRDI